MAIFQQRLIELREERKETRQEVANNLKISRASLEYYEKGKRKPDIDVLLRIAKYFNVSADYLLGLSDVKTVDRDIKFICNYTGLNEEAVESIRKLISVARDKEAVIRHLLTQTKFMIRVLE